MNRWDIHVKIYYLIRPIFHGGFYTAYSLENRSQAEAPIIFILGTIVYLGGKMNKKTQSE